MVRIHNKRGQLTTYGLSCGYVETDKKDYTKRLYMEHGVYFVSVRSACGSWDIKSFRLLSAARVAFKTSRGYDAN